MDKKKEMEVNMKNQNLHIDKKEMEDNNYDSDIKINEMEDNNYHFEIKNNEKEDNIKNINVDKKKIIYKSLSQNFTPSLIKYKNIKLLKFPKIFPKKGEQIYKGGLLKKNNLLIKTNSQLNVLSNNNKDLKSFFSLKKKNLPLKGINNKFPHYSNYINNNINIFNKKKYYNTLNSLTNQSKQISKDLSFYSNNEKYYINEQIKKTYIFNNKFKEDKRNYLSE